MCGSRDCIARRAIKALTTWYGRNFLVVDLVVSLTAVITVALVLNVTGSEGELSEVLRGARATAYATLTSVSGAMLGFVIAAEAILMGVFSSAAQKRRLAIIITSGHMPTLWRVFTSTVRALGIATLISFIALFVDRDNSPCLIMFWLVAAAATVSAWRLLHCVLYLEKVVVLAGGPSKARSGGSPG